MRGISPTSSVTLESLDQAAYACNHTLTAAGHCKSVASITDNPASGPPVNHSSNPVVVRLVA
jgi:hypothetical protein